MSNQVFFGADEPKRLSEWIRTFEAWKQTYGDVMCRADAGYNNVEMQLTLEKPKRGKGSKHRSRKARPSD